MRILFIKLLLLFGCMATPLFPTEIPNGKMGVLLEGLDMVKGKDAKIAIQVWISELMSQYSAEKKAIDLLYYSDKEAAINDFISGKIGYLTLNTYFYLKEQEKLRPQTKSIYTFYATPKNYLRFVLVTKKENPVQIKNYKNKVLGIPKTNYMESLYLDSLLMNSGLPVTTKFFSGIKKFDKESTVLLKLFFDKVDICIVPENVWDLMVEMNPQMTKKLKIIEKSEQVFLTALSLINKHWDNELFEIHQKSTQIMKETGKGKKIVNLLKIDSYALIEERAMIPLLSYYEQYKKLKEKRDEQ